MLFLSDGGRSIKGLERGWSRIVAGRSCGSHSRTRRCRVVDMEEVKALRGCHGARLLRRVIHCAPSAQDPQLDPRGPSQLAARIHTRDSLLSLRCARTKRLLYLGPDSCSRQLRVIHPGRYFASVKISVVPPTSSTFCACTFWAHRPRYYLSGLTASCQSRPLRFFCVFCVFRPACELESRFFCPI